MNQQQVKGQNHKNFNQASVRQFWEKNPLWSGESSFVSGTREFFEEQREVIFKDGFAGKYDQRLIPNLPTSAKILDLGCGIGVWEIEFFNHGFINITAADLTQAGLELTKQRCKMYGFQADLCQQSAEDIGFQANTFDYVHCNGVIHHTPDTQACIREIARVLKPDGKAMISVYYRNILLKSWPKLRWLRHLLGNTGSGLRGRGRENILLEDDVNEVVRIYDGADNPIGKSYSRREFIQMLTPYFEVEQTFLHYFPARSLPFRLPSWIHLLLDRNLGFMIHAIVKKIDTHEL